MDEVQFQTSHTITQRCCSPCDWGGGIVPVRTTGIKPNTLIILVCTLHSYIQMGRHGVHRGDGKHADVTIAHALF